MKIAQRNADIAAANDGIARLTQARADQAAKLEQLAAAILAGEGDLQSMAEEVTQMSGALRDAADARADGEEATAE